MAIRLQRHGDKWVAVCAVDFPPSSFEIYLDDAQHKALGDKFYEDYKKMGFIKESGK